MADVTQFRALDLETNSVDVKKAEVAQVAFDTAPLVDGLPDLTQCVTSMVYCEVSTMPPGAARVNGLTMEMLAGKPAFARKVRAVVKAMIEPSTVLVTFNGARYDLPVVARYAANSKGLRSLVEDIEAPTIGERFEVLFERNHVDVARLWQIVKKRDVLPPWQCAEGQTCLSSSVFAGSLVAAYCFYFGGPFDDAHDASADNRGALAVLQEMLALEHFALKHALHYTTHPLPGDVDYAGRFVWEGDQVVARINPHAGTPLEDMDKGFLRWMLEKDFHRDTKNVLREFLAGRYPERKYEDEHEPTSPDQPRDPLAPPCLEAD